MSDSARRQVRLARSTSLSPNPVVFPVSLTVPFTAHTLRVGACPGYFNYQVRKISNSKHIQAWGILSAEGRGNCCCDGSLPHLHADAMPLRMPSNTLQTFPPHRHNHPLLVQRARLTPSSVERRLILSFYGRCEDESRRLHTSTMLQRQDHGDKGVQWRRSVLSPGKMVCLV